MKVSVLALGLSILFVGCSPDPWADGRIDGAVAYRDDIRVDGECSVAQLDQREQQLKIAKSSDQYIKGYDESYRTSCDDHHEKKRYREAHPLKEGILVKKGRIIVK
jgi:hypothetical protein